MNLELKSALSEQSKMDSGISYDVINPELKKYILDCTKQEQTAIIQLCEKYKSLDSAILSFVNLPEEIQNDIIGFFKGISAYMKITTTEDENKSDISGTKNEQIIFGDKLKELRNDINLEEMAKAIGITPRALADYESGIRTPRDEVKVLIAKTFNIPLREMIHHEAKYMTRTIEKVIIDDNKDIVLIQFKESATPVKLTNSIRKQISLQAKSPFVVDWIDKEFELMI